MFKGDILSSLILWGEKGNVGLQSDISLQSVCNGQFCEIAVKKSCKYSEYGLLEHLCSFIPHFSALDLGSDSQVSRKQDMFSSLYLHSC